MHNLPVKKKFRGRHKFVCEVDGMCYFSEYKRVRWDGAIVHVDNLEQRQPQDMTRAKRDKTDVKDAQVEPGHDSDQGDGYNYLDETYDEQVAQL